MHSCNEHPPELYYNNCNGEVLAIGITDNDGDHPDAWTAPPWEANQILEQALVIINNSNGFSPDLVRACEQFVLRRFAS